MRSGYGFVSRRSSPAVDAADAAPYNRPMRRTLLPHLVAFATLGGPLACGPAPEPAAPTAAGTAAPKAAPSATVAAAAPLDLKPVAEPADLVGMLRWKSPDATLKHAASCAGVGAQLFDAAIKVGV